MIYPVYSQDQPISLCIPKVDKTVREKNIRELFKKLNFGSIDRIDFVSWKKSTNQSINDNRFVRVFVHFKSWNESSSEIRTQLLNGSTYNIVYNFPWYWKIMISRLSKPNYS
jgi:hypothetical protein